MANIIDLFKGLKINKLKTGAIVAHINNLISSDQHFKAKYQHDPVGVLVQFGLSRKLSAALVLETMKNQQGSKGIAGAAAGITDCCCTGSITISCGDSFYDKMPRIDDIKGWSKIASGK